MIEAKDLRIAQEDLNKENIEEVKVESNYIFVEDLPSKYKFYPADTKIYIKPLSVKQVKALAGLTENNFNLIINSVLNESIKGIKVDDLLINDKIYIIFYLRALTYKEALYEIDYFCDKCSKETTYNFSVDVLNVNYVKDNISLSFNLPVSKDNVTLKFKTIKDESRIEEFIKINSNQIKDFDEDIFNISYDISEVNNAKISSLKSYEYILNMNPADFSYLLSYMEKINFNN